MKCPISRYLRVILLTFIIMNIDNKLTIACPSEVCICKWKGGKQTVECGGQLLSKIPEGMDPGTQVLNFSGNSLQVLQSERFLRMDLINLQKIFLSRNQLIKIHEKAFRGLSNLVELDLSDNMLQQVPTETFQDYTSLMRLSLSGNPIRELKTSAFRHLAFLTTLELSNCQIDKIENEAFIGMDNLEWLRLDGNRISTIEGNHILPKSLHGINLQSNRWYCDCHLTDFHAWLINYNIPQIEEPKCIEPVRLKGQVIKSLKKDELACLPDIRPKSTYTEISEGRNISLMCTVRAIPEATVLWLFNGQVLTNDSFLENLHMYYYIDETGGEEKRSEVFIYNIGPEDNGTFSCIARNTAGTSFTNYTIRVLIKEPPVVKEVSFPKQYMHIIVASIGGIGTLVLITMCTIIIKCRKKEPRNKSNKSETQTNDSGLLKCPSIINEEDMSPKATKENGIIIGSGGLGGGLGSGGGMMGGGGGGGGGHGGGQIKQNFMMYVATMPQGHILDTGNMQLSHQSTASSPPINSGQNSMGMGGGIVGGSNMSSQYCSPQSSLRNYHHHHHQDKNPDLINDAESVKNKLKADSEYEGSDCSTGPCSIQGNFENCYQLSNQFGSQIIRPPAQQGGHRFTTMSTMPRGMHGGGNKGPPTSQGTGGGVGPGGNAGSVITSMGGIGGPGLVGVNSQHQVDVHLNPVCFLGQDGYAYDFSNNHIHSGPTTVTASQPNFYRTLPHNRGHNKLHGSAANPGTRYSLEAEFLQRTATPPYDKYAVHNMRFTAEGYPVHPMQQYPSPPDGYKGGDYSLPEPLNAGQSICPTTSFQQWPPCLPGYHAQPIRYPTGTIGLTSQHSVPSVPPPPSLSSVASAGASPSCTSTSSNHTQTATTSTSTLTTEVKKRCVGAQTTELDPDTIPECEEENETTSNSGSTSKLRHLSGPLADSPDEGYVGDSQESSDI